MGLPLAEDLAGPFRAGSVPVAVTAAPELGCATISSQLGPASSSVPMSSRCSYRDPALGAVKRARSCPFSRTITVFLPYHPSDKPPATFRGDRNR